MKSHNADVQAAGLDLALYLVLVELRVHLGVDAAESLTLLALLHLLVLGQL